MSIETHVKWIASEAHWAVYDEVDTIVGFYITYGEAIQAYKDYCKKNFPEFYDD